MVIQQVDLIKTLSWTKIFVRRNFIEKNYDANITAELIYAKCIYCQNHLSIIEKIIQYSVHRIRKLQSKSERLLEHYQLVGKSVTGKDGSTSLEKLSNLNEFHPIQVTEYALAQGINMSCHLSGGSIMS